MAWEGFTVSAGARSSRNAVGVPQEMYDCLAENRRGEGGLGMRHHRRLIGPVVVVVAALSFAAVASANVQIARTSESTPTHAAKWLTSPTCMATRSTLTCTGTATGVARPYNNPRGIGLSPLQAGMAGRVHYTCSDPILDAYEASYQSDYIAAVDIRNGGSFTITLTPNATPFGLSALFSCWGAWTRDPSYYEISIDIGWGFGSGSEAVILTGPVGTVTAS
jgi:hypothetical protein